MTTPSSASVPWDDGRTAADAVPGNGSSPAAGPAARTLWARRPATAGERVTARARRLVEGLPDWEPLPPGESLVRRRRT